MFSKLAILAAAAASFAVVQAAPMDSTCNTAPIQCCQQTFQSDNAAAAILHALLGVNVQDVTAQVGLQCTPITVIGLGSGANCSSKPLCCKDVKQAGLVAIGCTPVDVTL